ncbi:MAG: response regulator [Deltaproteobacteria bacterium]|nr:response regulator [Deltaproteobacteria bacterium]
MEPKTVLFVDDEINILKSIKRITFNQPFKSLFANSGAEALEIADKNSDITVLITDMRMPKMTGLELLKEFKGKHPKAVRIVLSGYSHITTLLTAINQGEIFRYILKPWENDAELLDAINAAFEHYEEAEKAVAAEAGN